MIVNRHSRIVVAGAGSIGCYVGGCLAHAGRDVTLLLRFNLAEAMARKGLQVSDLDGRDWMIAPSVIRLSVDAAEALAHADVVLVTVKSGATADMADAIARHAPADAIVVSLQNGVGNADTLRAHLKEGQAVVAGMVAFNVVQTRDDDRAPRFHRASSGIIQIARGIPELGDLLDVPGASVLERADMPAVLWSKLLLNLNNALNALSGLPLAQQLADRRWRRLLARQMGEGITVLKAAGIRPASFDHVPARALPHLLRLPDSVFRVVARRMLAIDPHARSSMWEDLERRRTTEIDYLQGAILARARAAGVAAPLTERITQLIKIAEQAGRGSPHLRPEQIAQNQM